MTKRGILLMVMLVGFVGFLLALNTQRPKYESAKPIGIMVITTDGTNNSAQVANQNSRK